MASEWMIDLHGQPMTISDLDRILEAVACGGEVSIIRGAPGLNMCKLREYILRDIFRDTTLVVNPR